MNDLQTEQVVERAAGRIVAKLSAGRVQSAFDPTIIITIADLIFDLIERCQASRESIVSASQNPRFIHRVQVRRAVKRSLSRSEWRNFGPATVEAVFEAAKEAGETEVTSLVESVDRLN